MPVIRAGRTFRPDKVHDGDIVTRHIATSAITTEKIADSAVVERKIGTSAVTTSKLADSAVTTQKINDGAVVYAKLGTGSIRGTPNEEAKDIRHGTKSLTGPGPHDIATGLTTVDICLANVTDALLKIRTTWSGSTCTVETDATPTQSYTVAWLAKGKP